MVGACDATNVVVLGIGVAVAQLARAPIDEVTEFARLDEEDLVFAVAEASVGAIATHEPQRGRNLGVEKQFSRKVDDAVNQPRLDERLAYIALARAISRERALRQHKARLAVGPEVVEEVLYPRVVGVAGWWRPVRPTRIAA